MKIKREATLIVVAGSILGTIISFTLDDQTKGIFLWLDRYPYVDWPLWVLGCCAIAFSLGVFFRDLRRRLSISKEA